MPKSCCSICRDAAGSAPLILDVRTAPARSLDERRIPAAIDVDPERPEGSLDALSPGQEIIACCT